MNNIVAIIVTFNRKELLGEAIEALCSQTIQSFDIMVVDNASTDGTKEYIFSYVNNGTIQYFNTGKNIGGAGGFHFGQRGENRVGWRGGKGQCSGRQALGHGAARSLPL